MVILLWNFPLKRLLLVRVFPNSSIYLHGAIVFTYKNLQKAPLLIIFVDILPKVGAVSFAEFFHQEPCCCCPSIILSNKLNLCKESRSDSLEQAVGAMAAKDWIVLENVIEIHGYFPKTVAKAINFLISFFSNQIHINWKHYIQKIWWLWPYPSWRQRSINHVKIN